VFQNPNREIQFLLNPTYPPPEMGMEETATNLVALYELIDYALTKGFEPLDINSWQWRVAKFLLWDLSNVSFLGTLNHELGHGHRHRDFGGNPSYSLSYNYLPLWPWKGFKTSYCYYHGITPPLDREERLRRTVGGLEASGVLKDVTVSRLYSTSNYTYITLLFLGYSKFNLLLYVLRTDPENPWGDVSDWLEGIAELGGDSSQERISSLYSQLKRESILFCVLDPTLWQAVYYTIYANFMKGMDCFKVPMLEIGNFEVMPEISYGITSLGTEKYLRIHWRRDRIFGNVYFRYLWRVNQADGKGLGFCLANLPLIDETCQVSLTCDSWCGEKIGGAFEIILQKSIENSHYSLHLGMKSDGYLRGKSYGASQWLRFGIKIEL